MFLLVLLFALACDHIVNSGYLRDNGLGSECLYDEDCITRNSFCKGNKICACKIGYQYDVGSDVCFPKEVGLKCNEDYDCSALQNAKCTSNGKCECKNNYVASNDKSQCLPSMRLTSLCEEDSQCHSVMNRSHCDPYIKRCVCEKGYKQDSHQMRCAKILSLHQPCMKTADCEDEQTRGKVECKDTGVTFTCECAEGYVEKDNTCLKGGSSQATLSLFILIALLPVKWLI